MKNRLIFVLALTGGLIFQLGSAYSCAIPSPGRELGRDELIDKSKVIFLMELDCDVRILRKSTYKSCQIKILEVLKGNANQSRYKYTVTLAASTKAIVTSPENPDGIVFDLGTDFNGHQDAEFWQKGGDRSHGIWGSCAPSRPYIKGEKYLVFPDYFGAWKASEVVRSESDKWYLYVKERIGRKN